MTIFDDMLDAIYASPLAVPAVLTPATDASDIPLTVIDKTEGVMLDEGNSISIATTKPAAIVRMSEISAKGMVRDDLKKGSICFNGRDWVIVATQPKPSSNGAGELYLILQAQ